jgi:FAD/FMN-containing dehydrogenase
MRLYWRAILSSDRVSLLLSRLENHLDAAVIFTGDGISDGYATDATRRGLRPLAVLRPRNPADVLAILSIANEIGQPIVVQGGRTGLSGGVRPFPDEVSLSLERMSGVECTGSR